MSKDKETLLILIPGFPKDEADSTCLPSQQSFVRVAKEMYPDLNIIVLSFQYPYHTQPYRIFNVDVIPFSLKTKKGIAKVVARQRIRRTLEQIRNDYKIVGLLSFWCSECAMVGKRFADKYGLKHFCWIRGQDARAENKDVKKINPRPDELIALSDFLQEEFEKNHGIKPAYVIPPGIDRRQFEGPDLPHDIDLIAVGSLIPLKQFDIFLKLVAEAKKQLPNIKAVLIGDGPERKKLEEKAYMLGIADNIFFTGELTQKDTLQWMKRSRLLLHTSSYEGFSGVCLEALYAGCQVISFCWAMKEPIDNWFVAKDAEEMKVRMMQLIQEPNNKEQVGFSYVVQAAVEKVMGLYTPKSNL